MDGDFSGLSAEHETFHADEIAEVKEFLEHGIIESLVFFGTDVIAGDINLNASLGVHQLSETCLTHDSSSHQTTCDADFTRRFSIFAEVGFDFVAVGIDGIFCCGIGFNVECAEFVQRLSALYFLFVEL